MAIVHVIIHSGQQCMISHIRCFYSDHLIKVYAAFTSKRQHIAAHSQKKVYFQIRRFIKHPTKFLFFPLDGRNKSISAFGSFTMRNALGNYVLKYFRVKIFSLPFHIRTQIDIPPLFRAYLNEISVVLLG